MPVPGRNVKCSCGSGKKYKACCGDPKKVQRGPPQHSDTRICINQGSDPGHGDVVVVPHWETLVHHWTMASTQQLKGAFDSGHRHMKAALSAVELCEPENSLIPSGLLIHLAASQSSGLLRGMSGGITGTLPILEAGVQLMMNRHFGIDSSLHTYQAAEYVQQLDLFTFSPSEWKLNDIRFGFYAFLMAVDMYIEGHEEYNIMTKSPILLEAISCTGRLIAQAHENAIAAGVLFDRNLVYIERTAAFRNLPVRCKADVHYLQRCIYDVDHVLQRKQSFVVSMVAQHVTGPRRDEFMCIVAPALAVLPSGELVKEEMRLRFDELGKKNEVIQQKRDRRKGLATCALAGCGLIETRAGEFQKCGRCKTARYCSHEHAKEHWKVHKKDGCQPQSG